MKLFAAKEVIDMELSGDSANRARWRPVDESANADAVNLSMLKVKI